MDHPKTTMDLRRRPKHYGPFTGLNITFSTRRENSRVWRREKMEGDEILDLYEIQYSDLKLLSSPSLHPSSSHQLNSIMENLGPGGPGLLAVTGVPKASLLRRKLLPLARKLALLNPDDRKHILKEHNLGSDVPLKNPERSVSSFAMQLRYTKGRGEAADVKECSDAVDHDLRSLLLGNLDDDKKREVCDTEFKNLGVVFEELGCIMMELGLCFARICDKAFGGHELEQSLLESCSAKGRLIHYHSTLDSRLLKQAGRKGASVKKQTIKKKVGGHLDGNGNASGSCGIHDNLWQQWHYDYGIFTVLTDPMFLLASSSPETTETKEFSVSKYGQCCLPDGHSYLQIYDPRKNKVLMVKSSPESFIVQVGESADIISKGKLRSTLHCVRRPSKMENLSRETFVVFLQPSWNKTFPVSEYPLDHCNLGHQEVQESEENCVSNQNSNTLNEEIQMIVPPLSARLKDGMTFAEFSRETTRQYYGGSGLQSNK